MESLFDSPPKSGGKLAMPEAKYTRFGEKIRQAIPGPMQCSMACGGRNCKWENPARWSDEDQVIKGVFSSWVLDDVVAMSRPSTWVIHKYDLIKQFKESNICSIINLQRPGEHASCGPPLHKESLFTYDPKTFMDNDIFFYNFGWKDYGVASLDTILDMVKVMAFALSEGRVAVHCHAGLGRTGVLIACYLVYAHRMDASSAINTVRKRRANSIQTRGQIACIQEFAQFLKPLRIVFPQVVPHAERLTLVQFLHRQRHLLHGFESRELRYTPKIVHLVCQRLAEIATTSADTRNYGMRARSNTGLKLRSGKRSRKGTLRRSNTVATMKEVIPGAFVNEHLDSEENLLDPMESKEMNALLSPRLSRRGDSAKSKTSSSSRSLSGPGSPIPSMHSDADVPVVEEVPGSGKSDASPPMKPKESDVKGPRVVMVKQGSRSALLPSATNIIQTSSNSDSNLNNNNQFVPLSKQKTISSQNEVQTIGCVENSTQESSVPNSLNHIEDSPAKTSPSEKTTSLPSPTPSAYEPTIPVQDSKGAGDEPQEIKKAGGDKPPLQNYRSSAGRSQRVLPTGMPVRSRVGSGKGKRKQPLPEPEDDIANDVVKDLESKDGHLEERELEQNDSATKTLQEAECNLNDIKDAIDVIVEHAVQQVAQDGEDNELDEIIEMKDDDGPFLSDSDVESQLSDSGSRPCKAENGLSQSIASKISWTEEMNKKVDDMQPDSLKNDHEESNSSEEVTNDKSVNHLVLHDERDGRQTPLMYRAEKNADLLDEANGKPEALSMEESSVPDTGEDPAKDETLLPEEKTKHTTANSPRRPKSAQSFLKRLSEKSQRLPNTGILPMHTLTQSLCDLRKYDDDAAGDDHTLFGPGMSSRVTLPLSPRSKSNSSDDVRTPTGSASKKRIKDPITVAMALAYKLTDNEWLWEKVYTKQVELNTREGAWSGLEKESDAHILSCLLWSWIEHLSQPIMSPSEVNKLVEMSRPAAEKVTAATECPDPALFELALASLGKPICSTFQCILHCLLSLPPLSHELEASVIRRIMSAFTQSHLEDSASFSGERNSLELLVSILQNYLIKTRAREQKNRATREGKVSRKTSSVEMHATQNAEEVLKSCQREERDTAESIETSYSRGEGDSSSSTSSVSELPLRIIVS